MPSWPWSRSTARAASTARRSSGSSTTPSSDTSTAVQQTNRMLDSDGVELVVGGGGSSGIALAMDPITSGKGITFIATEGARQIVEPAAEHRLTFKTTFNDTVMIEKLIEYWKAKDVTRVAFMPDTSSFGQSAQEELERLAPEAGIKVFTAAFDPAANDLTPPGQAARRERPAGLPGLDHPALRRDVPQERAQRARRP
ncbi:ABC transporter substrate-binding protein [Nonomuraea ferruginea]